MAQATAVLVPGVTENELKANYAEAMARYGTTLPAFEGIFCATPRDDTDAVLAPPLRRVVSDRAIGSGELVACSGGVLYGGYEGTATGTWVCQGQPVPPSAPLVSLHRRWRVAIDAMLEQCQPGTAPGRLREAWLETGEPLPPVLLAHGVGIGVEPPLVGGALGPVDADPDPLHADTVLAVQGYVWEPGIGGYLGSETVHISADGPVTMSRLADPLSQAFRT